MATFKRQKRLTVDPQEETAEITPNVTEVLNTAEVTAQKPTRQSKIAVLKHQFDESGLRYEERKLPLKALFLFLLVMVVLGGGLFITLTEHGKGIIQSITNQTTTIGLVNSFSSTSATANSDIEIPLSRDFSESTETEIRNQLNLDATSVEEQLDPIKFATPDWELELGL